jgi:hypothetical protein
MQACQASLEPAGFGGQATKIGSTVLGHGYNLNHPIGERGNSYIDGHHFVVSLDKPGRGPGPAR